MPGWSGKGALALSALFDLLFPTYLKPTPALPKGGCLICWVGSARVHWPYRPYLTYCSQPTTKRKATNGRAKDNLLHNKKPRFALQNVAYRKLSDKQAVSNNSHQESWEHRELWDYCEAPNHKSIPSSLPSGGLGWVLGGAGLGVWCCLLGWVSQCPLKNTYSATITTAKATHATMTPRLGFSLSFTTSVLTVACLLARLTTTIVMTRMTKM